MPRSDRKKPPVAEPVIVPLVYTVAQLADLFQCTIGHVQRQRKAKAIPGEIRIGKSVRFSRDVVDRWLVEGRPAVTGGNS